MVSITFHQHLCKGCGLCAAVCPRKIIVRAENFNALGFQPFTVLEMDKCTGCSACALMCPDVVIEIEKSDTKSA